ncbi:MULTISPECIES: MBL fold metallo-hydrolase [Nocardioides]|uniref:Rhodanese-like domain-containing protein n=1 Tax=Nocardioides vastitatis TaxID=2568655 RepID=A0ABW0ZDP1_9ACTN|nr:MBL fold metallo-hydrolase [Nocardioides sp.]THJ08644.1 MBL fold metallo-hydrolase [Nocardioides sp.]
MTSVRDEGLANSAYLVDLGDGRALAVDACRDLRALRRAAGARGLTIAFAADTHLHADFLSGAVQLAADDGAQVVASASGGREFPHLGLEDGQELDLGGLTLQAMTTPGHTDEHVAFLLRDDATTLGVFTGGSLIAGSAARTDLVDPDRTEELARAQYRSLRRLAELDESVVVWPTHGGGSFCATSATSAGGATTIGLERTTNPMLNAADEEEFVRRMLGSLGSYPPYFLRLGEENRRGPAVLPAALSLEAVASYGEALVVDVRSPAAFAAGHPAGALSIPLRPAFASWLGWLAPNDRPLLLLRDPDQDLEEVLWQAAKIGYTNFVGEIAGGLQTWTDAGLPVSSHEMRAAFPSHEAVVLDVRQESEFLAGHVPGAAHVELGSLADEVPELPDGAVVVMCGHGERASTAASILRRSGFEDVTVLAGGPKEWVEAQGTHLETGG